MTTRQGTALDAFLDKKAEFEALLKRMADFSDDHFGVPPDEVTWGHVGALTDWLAQMRRVSDAMFQEGEFTK
jgi:hypothetical protein